MNHPALSHCLCLALCLALAPLSASGTASPEKSPAQAVAMLQKAVDTKDTTLMDRHIDLDSVIGKAADAVLADTGAVRRAQESSPTVAVILAGLGSDERTRGVVRQLLVAETTQFVRYGVSSGAFAGTAPKGSHPGAGLFSSLLRGGIKDKKTFGPVILRKETGDEALIDSSLDDAAGGRSYPLELRLRRQDGVWRITEIANIHTLIGQTAQGRDKNKGKAQ